MTRRQWRFLIADSFRVESRDSLNRARVERRLKLKLKRIRRRRLQERKARLRQYAIGWCHVQALRDNRVRTIRLELERQERERRDRKVLHYMQPGIR